MATFIAFWNWVPDHGWQKKKFADRVSCMASAVFTAEIELRMKLGKPADETWIFVSPEYTFAGIETADQGKPAMQTSTANETSLLSEMASLTRDYPKLLLAPGTIAVAEQKSVAPHQARNTSHAYYGGASAWRVDKCVSVGEISASDKSTNFLAFKAGLGYALATVANCTYGAEICKDATGTGTLPNQVKRHIVLAAGAAHDNVANKATELQIIADWGKPSVYDYTGEAKKEIKPYGKEETRGTLLQYYVV